MNIFGHNSVRFSPSALSEVETFLLRKLAKAADQAGGYAMSLPDGKEVDTAIQLN